MIFSLFTNQHFIIIFVQDSEPVLPKGAASEAKTDSISPQHHSAPLAATMSSELSISFDTEQQNGTEVNDAESTEVIFYVIVFENAFVMFNLIGKQSQHQKEL